ncbi:MAG TPA: DUF4328 domain-containing protein [Methyloceanibacter sp.]|nr:DUF4328 domain-containing protein [Methyloceanibacter sp.]
MAETDTPYLYKDLTKHTRWAKWLLWASVAISVISVISGIMDYRLLQAIAAGQFDSDAEMTAAAQANDLRQGIIGIAYIVLLLATSVVVLVWIYSANRNAHALGAAGMRFTPGWAVGWYFIPIFNLWKPYQAMKEIWKASADPGNWQAQPRSPLLPWWWFLWIASCIVANAMFRYTLKAEELDELINASGISIASDALDVPLDLVLIAIIDRIWRMQAGHKAATLPPEGATEPAPAT